MALMISRFSRGSSGAAYEKCLMWLVVTINPRIADLAAFLKSLRPALAAAPQNRNERGMTEFVSASDGVPIAYETAGEGAPIVLVHGFGASRAVTWANTNWYQTLMRAGRRVIAMDCRGHGESGKPHDEASYDEGLM